MAKYKKQTREATPDEPPVRSLLDQLVLAGAQQMIQQALESELRDYLGRERYEHHKPEETRRYRNGAGKERRLGVGCGTIPIRVPRLRESFESQIVARYQRMSAQMEAMLPELYLHGLSTGDFRQCLGAFVGDGASLSASSIVRLKQQWEEDYQHWKKRALEKDYLYIWADGVYPKAGPKEDTMAVLVVVGLTGKGEKEILAIEEGYRESAESWRVVFRDLKKRGVEWIGLAIADGVAGLWKALRDIYPHARWQRCLVHKMRNVLDKVPLRAHDEVLQASREIYHATSQDQARAAVQAFRRRYGALYPKAVDSWEEAGENLFTYFLFPRQHWKSIKSTNVIESLFSAVKLRTDAARRIPKRESALYLVFKLLTTQQYRLRRIHGCKIVQNTIEQMKLQKPSRVRIAA
jgi:putative transposase